MYNEEYKRRFISERNDKTILPKNYLENLFERAAIAENEYGKDVCNFTVYEIIEYYKTLNISSVESISVINSQFVAYTQWCLQNNLVTDNQNHFLEMKFEHFKSCTNKALFDMKMVSRKIILEWVDGMQNPRDQFILLGLFEGIKGQDFCELTKLRPKDIDGNIATLCTGRKVKISNKLISIIEDCIDTVTYFSVSGKEVKTMPLVDRGYIIKDYPNMKEDTSDFQHGRKVYNTLKRFLQSIDMFPLISANSIYESGKLDMIKQRSSELGMTCKEYIYSEYIKEVEEKYDCTIIKRIYIIKYEDYLQ